MTATNTATVSRSIVVGAPSRLTATRVRQGNIHASTKEARMDLQDKVVEVQGKGKKRLVSLGGDAANGLLAIGGASLVINGLLQTGVSVQDLYAAVAEQPTVKNPVNKVRDHVRNMAHYALPPQMAASGITVALRKAGVVCAGDPMPAVLTVNGIAYTGKGYDLQKRLLPTDKLESPLLVAIGLAIRTLEGQVQAPTVRRAVAETPSVTWEAVDVSSLPVLPVSIAWESQYYVVGARKPRARKAA